MRSRGSAPPISMIMMTMPPLQLVLVLVLLLPTSCHASPTPMQARWIHGALVPATPASYASVCSTANGCTSGAFLSCADASRRISKLTFASYGNPKECPEPAEGSCSHPDSMKVAEAACLGKTNCTVAKGDYDKAKLSCSGEIASGTDNVVIAGLCGDGKERRANLLRYEFTLETEAATAEAVVSAAGYQVLWLNGKRVSERKLEPVKEEKKKGTVRASFGGLSRRAKPKK